MTQQAGLTVRRFGRRPARAGFVLTAISLSVATHSSRATCRRHERPQQTSVSRCIGHAAGTTITSRTPPALGGLTLADSRCRHYSWSLVAGSHTVANGLDLSSWLREQCSDFRFDVGGVFQRSSDESWWPLTAADPADLEQRLERGGHLLPLPREPAALANVLEVSIVNFLAARAARLPDAEVQRGSERGYPDLEFSGAAFGGGFHAVDVKAARRAANGRQTQSRITLYTGNTYFKWPDLHWPGTLRAFNEYVTHLDLLMIYTLNPDSNARVEDLEIIVQQAWRIASKERSSTTREYIGAVTSIDALRAGDGAFASVMEFYLYWRKFPFRVSPQVQTQLQRLLSNAQAELTEYRRRDKQGKTE